MRPKKRFGLAVVTAALLTAALVAPAAAHDLVVGPSEKSVWVGGWLLPEPAQSAPPMFGPYHLPPSHATGLPHACEATGANPAVTFVAPPFGSCHHGVMP